MISKRLFQSNVAVSARRFVAEGPGFFSSHQTETEIFRYTLQKDVSR